MTIDELLKDKTKKIKEKTITISTWLLDGSLPTDELIAYAEKAKDSEKATCIEAFEYASKESPAIVDENVFSFVTHSLTEKAPRVKWESARVIGNSAFLFPDKLNKPISNLLINAEHDGTVVRWASAYALSEILMLNTKHTKSLLASITIIYEKEQDNAIKKKYLEAINKTK
jgi:hypothetical protein